jgi:hypothetical protein
MELASARHTNVCYYEHRHIYMYIYIYTHYLRAEVNSSKNTKRKEVLQAFHVKTAVLPEGSLFRRRYSTKFNKRTWKLLWYK